MPTAIKITPLITDMVFMKGLIFLNADKNKFNDTELIKKGTASPIA